ncbi:MAG: crotonase/enoyl-CoA hydratase family protein [Candidatus Thiodiazotropha sp.]
METATLTPVTHSPIFRHAEMEISESLSAAILYMHPAPRPCFTPELLSDIKAFQAHISTQVAVDLALHGESSINYVVLASAESQTFNLGGDLNLFVELIERRDRDALMHYATDCIDGAYGFSSHLEKPVTSIALVEGNAQGGGFEAALSCNVIIAERGTFLGFPEVLFNMFPGMGAYSFLSRRVGSGLAERLIYSGELYSAESLFEMGVVDVLAEQGGGRTALADYIRMARRRSNAMSLLRHVRTEYNAVPYSELLEITSKWVDAAMRLKRSEIGIMQRLVRAQDKRATKLAVDTQSALRKAT